MGIELGILSLADLQRDLTTGALADPAQRTVDILAYAELADRLGLDAFGLGEHHAGEFAVPSPAVTLAAIAARSSRIRLSSAVTVLSVLDPVRVYEDFAALDLVSGGRAEIVAGRSAFAEPFALFGADLADYDRLFAEKLELLLRIREEERVTWSGTVRPALQDAAVLPRAVQEPLPVWVGVGGSPDSAERAGRLGLPMVLGYIGGPVEIARRAVDVYRAAGDRAGHPEKLRLGISTHFYAAESARAALGVHPYYHEYLRPKTPGGRGWIVERAQFEAGMRRGQALMIGSSEQVAEKILDLRETLGIDRFFGQVDWGGLPRELVVASITRLATEIAPIVRGA